MKQLKVLTIFMLLQTTLFAGEGIRFESLKWAEIKAKALKEKKMIFLDAFASWCGPCKYMEENVYGDKETADYFNTHFINVKVDMEVGEGPTLSEEFEVSAYPTFLFFSPEGKLVHKAVGALDIEGFLTLGQKALNPEKQFFTLKERAKAGTLSDTDFLTWTEEADKLEDADKDELVKKFLALKKDMLANKEIASIFLYHAAKSDQEVSFILRNRKKIMILMNWDSTTIDAEYYNLVFSQSLKAYRQPDGGIDSFLAIFRKLDPARAGIADADIRFRIQLFADKDPEGAMKLLITYLNDPKKMVPLEMISNWMIDNAEEFSDTDFSHLDEALNSFNPRSMDRGKECWLFLMQMMTSVKTGKAEKAKEFAMKAYAHPSLPETYKKALRSAYEIK